MDISTIDLVQLSKNPEVIENCRIIEKFVDFAIKKQCSDIFIDEGAKGALRLKRETKRDVMPKPFTKEGMLLFFHRHAPQIDEDIQETINNPKREAVDAAIEYQGRRFRANICLVSTGLSCVLRLLNAEVPDIKKLNVPACIENLEKLENGLVLIVGETGSGKTMTLAGMMEQINKQQKKNIITVEDPIEYQYDPKEARIVQREVGRDTPSFAAAIKSALRSAPDIVLVGEMRDLETIKSAIELAETGHLVFGTLHSKSCTDTPDRIVDVFPPEQQQQVRVELAGVLRAVIHQRLAKSSFGKIVPLVEIMITNNQVASGIRDHSKWRSSEIRDYMRSNPQMGNVHIVDNIVWHVENGRLSVDDVARFAEPADAAQIMDILAKKGLVKSKS